MLVSIEAPPNLRAILDQFEKWGNVVEFSLFEVPEILQNDGFNREIHSQVALLTLLELQTKTRNAGYSFSVSIDESFLEPQNAQIWTPRQFFGPYFDWETRRVILRGNGVESLSKAVLDPPYRLRDSDLHEQSRAFVSLTDELFGDPNSIQVLSWPVESSNIFDAGLEWWGSYFWTVFAPQKNWMIGITASSTD